MGLPVVSHHRDRWLPLRKLTILILVLGFGAWAGAATASLRGSDADWSGAIPVYLVLFVIAGAIYLSGIVRAYRLPRDERQLVGVGLTPDGLANALFDTRALPRPLAPVTAAALVTSDDVLLFIGGQMFNLTRSDLYDVKLGIEGDRIWLLIQVGRDDYALHLRGPVLGRKQCGAPPEVDHSGRGSDAPSADSE